MRSLCVAAMVIFLSQTALADRLTKQKVIELQKAGIGASVLIEKIQRDGIDFDMTADVMLELKKAGVSDEVLKALLAAKSANANGDNKPGTEKLTSSGTESSLRIRDLYAQRKYEDLADYLKSYLSQNPEDHKSRTILIMSLLKIGDRDMAIAEFSKLKAQGSDSIAKPYITKVQQLLDSLEEQEKTKANLVSALKRYNAKEAGEVVAQLHASPFQGEILRIYLDVYEGNFKQARERAAKFQADSIAERRMIKEVIQRITDSETTYNQLIDRIEIYLHSPVTPSFCSGSGDFMRTRETDFLTLSFQEYFDLVNKLGRLTPLNTTAMDLAFHAAVIASKYQDLERLGDTILNAKGNIRVPFYSSDRYFYFVIDSQKRRLYSEPDARPFRVRYAYTGRFRPLKEGNTNSWNSELIPFDLIFENIAGLSQNANGPWGTPEYTNSVLKEKGYAVKLEPNGVAPHYALMHYLHCVAGQERQESATRDFGQYVLHVINRPEIRAHLQDVKVPSSGFVDGFANATLYLASAISPQASAAQAQVLGEALQRDEANKAKMQEQNSAWYSLMIQTTFDLTDDSQFKEMERLVELL